MNTIIFSNDSAIKLYALLESIDLFAPNTIDKINVFYNYSNIDYYLSYIKTFSHFDGLNTLQYKNYKDDLISLLDDDEYTLLLTDDCLFIRPFNSFICNKEINYFSLTMGKNIANHPDKLIYSTQTSSTPFDIHQTIHGCIYKTSYLKQIFKTLLFKNQDDLCAMMKIFLNKPLLVGMNKESSCLLLDYHINLFDLNKQFLSGKKIQIDPYLEITNISNILTFNNDFIWRE